nr:MAG TPA: hypothetical protein [Caudoviricetes sp.]
MRLLQLLCMYKTTHTLSGYWIIFCEPFDQRHIYNRVILTLLQPRFIN